MYTISKEFHFSASHQLTHLAHEQPDHPCARLHGHNYVVRVILKGYLTDANGFIVDYNELNWFKTIIDTFYDHQHLNDVCGGDLETTAEHLAKRFYNIVETWMKERPDSEDIWVEAVEVQETPKTCARYGS